MLYAWLWIQSRLLNYFLSSILYLKKAEKSEIKVFLIVLHLHTRGLFSFENMYNVNFNWLIINKFSHGNFCSSRQIQTLGENFIISNMLADQRVNNGNEKWVKRRKNKWLMIEWSVCSIMHHCFRCLKNYQAELFIDGSSNFDVDAIWNSVRSG